MDFAQRLEISYYKIRATINESHHIYLVQHMNNDNFGVKKTIDVYNINVFEQLYNNPVSGTPKIICFCEEDEKLIVIEEYISGISLEKEIAEKKLSAEKISRYIQDLCDILQRLHSLEPPIIHRDIKPSNIIIDNNNHVVLLDFNAAKQYSTEKGTDTVFLGTRGYAAPEQYGFGYSVIQTDIYALGIMLKEMRDSLPEYTNCFDSIIEKCTQINPSDRYSEVMELKYALIDNENKKNRLSFADRVLPVLKKFIPPGYRTRKLWKMITASVVYLAAAYFSVTAYDEDFTHGALWTERIALFILAFSIIGCCFNYLDIRRLIPLSKHENRFLRYVGVALLCLTIAVLIFIILLIIEKYVFHMLI